MKKRLRKKLNKKLNHFISTDPEMVKLMDEQIEIWNEMLFGDFNREYMKLHVKHQNPKVNFIIDNL